MRASESAKSVWIVSAVRRNIFSSRSTANAPGRGKKKKEKRDDCEREYFGENVLVFLLLEREKALVTLRAEGLFPHYQPTVFANQIFSLHERENFDA